jgi:hypothetical protein
LKNTVSKPCASQREQRWVTQLMRVVVRDLRVAAGELEPLADHAAAEAGEDTTLACAALERAERLERLELLEQLAARHRQPALPSTTALRAGA